MNRPKYKHFKMKNKGIDDFINHLLIYKRDLEAYCDELEQSNKSLSNAYDDCLVTLHFWEEEYSKNRKALDKACKLIDDNYGSCPYDVKEFCTHKGECDGNSIRCWKEWLLKDE